MDILGLVGIVLGLITIIYFIVKQYSLIVAAPIATMIVVLFNGLPFIASIFGVEQSYMTALASFILSNISKIHG